MPTQCQNPTRSSPKKKRSKCKAMDSDGQEISTKKSRAGAKSLSMSQQPTLDEDSSLLPWRSGRSGAGTGGRAKQLERISALLSAPAWTSQSKGSTSLDSNIPVNPLTPEPLHKGPGSRAKKPPLPYSASDTVDPPAVTPTKPRRKKAKVTKNALIPPSSLEAAADRPSFHQCETGTRFGFSQSIVPPGTEPDLQVLNNPYMAAARENVAMTSLPAPITPTNQISVPPLPSRTVIKYLPAATTVSAKQDFVPPVPSRSTSAACPSDTLFYQNLDPALHSVGDGRLGQSDGSDASSEGSDSSTTDDEEEVDEEVAHSTWLVPRHAGRPFLEDAKGDCHAQHAIENAFPTLADDLPISVTEALTSSLVEWLEGGKQVEAGLWPDHKPDMAKLLFEDLSTWFRPEKTSSRHSAQHV
ncbi:hypothetical protein DFH29DRAFT_1010693 [Suillus ampliporus]|nr:hypothetical protein DFH29DRAFT_1010693 [Suillus ampliporus]